jgi:hypothetical protein
MPFTIITGGSFTSTGAGVKIPLPSSADMFVTTNITQMPLAPATGVVIRGEWYGSKFGLGATAQNDGIRWKKTNSTNALLIDTFATSTASNGFTYVASEPFVEAAVTGTTITQAAGAVASATNTYSNGDRVRIYSSTGMLQIAGMDFTINNVSGSAFTLYGLDSSGFAAGATAFQVRRISKLDSVEPRALYITAISKATRAVVTTSCDATLDYVVGMKIHFSIPQGMGMQEMNGLTGTITAIGAYTSNATYNLTVDIDSTNFSTFAFPASTAVPTSQLFATLAPAGQSTQYNPVTGVQTGYNFTLAPFHTGSFVPYMYLAGGAQSPAGAAADVINWVAYKLEN